MLQPIQPAVEMTQSCSIINKDHVNQFYIEVYDTKALLTQPAQAKLGRSPLIQITHQLEGRWSR